MVKVSNTGRDSAPPMMARPFVPREEVRTAILDAVGGLLQRYGYRKTSVEDIAQEAGISRATAYLYFAGKEDIVLNWVERQQNNRLCLLRDIAQPAPRSIKIRLNAILLARILTRFDDARPYMNTLQGQQGIDDLRAALRLPLLELRERLQESEIELVSGIVREGIAQGAVRPHIDPGTAARLLVIGTNALLPANLTIAQQDNRDEVESLTKSLIELLLRGLLIEQRESK